MKREAFPYSQVLKITNDEGKTIASAGSIIGPITVEGYIGDIPVVEFDKALLESLGDFARDVVIIHNPLK